MRFQLRAQAREKKQISGTFSPSFFRAVTFRWAEAVVVPEARKFRSGPAPGEGDRKNAQTDPGNFQVIFGDGEVLRLPTRGLSNRFHD